MLTRYFAALLLLVPLTLSAAEAGFEIDDAGTRLVDGVYLLDAEIDYRLSNKALEALDNGVPLTFALDIEVQRKRPWWWFDNEVAALEQRFELYYHALSDQYLLRNVNSGALYAYPTLQAVQEALGDIRGLPLLDASFIDDEDDYEVELRARLDIESLPLPLRPLAYVTPGWRLSSDWFVCALTR